MTDLTTIANVKAYLNITNSASDAVLSRMITAASQFIRSFLNRDITQATYTDTVDGRGHDRMSVKNYPITAVSSVKVDGQLIPAYTGYGSYGYDFDETGTQIVLVGPYLFTKGRRNVIVTYTAGYAAVPSDIEQACIELVTYRFQDSGRIGVSSKTLAGEVITFSQKDMQASTATLLKQWKRVITV